MQDIYFSPEFQTNLISVSEIKEKVLFFNSELPGVSKGGQLVAKCDDAYSLYFLEYYEGS